MSLLSICTNVANYIPLAAPSAIVGNTDETAVRLLGAAQAAGQALARKPQGGWVSMIREYNFATAALAQQSGTMSAGGPGGTGLISGLASTAGIVVGTWWAFGLGVPNDATVTAVTASTVTINLAPTQTGAGQYVFGQSDYTLPSDYQRPVDNTFWDRSRFWSMRGPQSPQQWQLYKSSVIGRASIQRRFRFRSVGGNTVLSIDPVPTDNGSQLVFEYVSNAWCKSNAGVGRTSWQADTDVGVLEEYLIELGTRVVALRRLGMAHASELDEYEREVGKAMSADGGAAILNLVSDDSLTLIGPWNLPETNFGGVVG